MTTAYAPAAELCACGRTAARWVAADSGDRAGAVHAAPGRWYEAYSFRSFENLDRWKEQRLPLFMEEEE